MARTWVCMILLYGLLAFVQGTTRQVIQWSRKRVSMYTPESPLSVQLDDILQFNCTSNMSTVFVVPLSIAKSCQSSEATVNSTGLELESPTDCLRSTPEIKIIYSNESANFQPGEIYHLANIPRDRPMTCSFAMSILVDRCLDCSSPSPSSSSSPSLSPSPSPFPSLTISSESITRSPTSSDRGRTSMTMSPSPSLTNSATTLSRDHSTLVVMCVYAVLMPIYLVCV